MVRTSDMIRRGTALAAVVVVLAAVAVGCSSGSSDGAKTRTKTADPVRNAASAEVGGSPTVAAGGGFTCGRTKAGGALCWGLNAAGQVGVPSTTPTRTPVPVTGLTSGVSSVASGAAQACAVLDDGTASCWGANGSGVLGNGSTAASATPVKVSGLTDAVQVATATNHSCARTKAGAIVCWGNNGGGALGDGTTTSSTKPVATKDLTEGATDVSTGQYHSCAVAGDGTVRCWGSNTFGQLGTGSQGQESPTPVQVQGLSDAVQVAAGSNFACALTKAGAVSCWGANTSGQLGNGTKKASPAPVAVKGLDQGVAGIAAGNQVACARLVDGTARCWGSNAHGQLGDGAVADSNEPHTVVGLKDVTSISAGAGVGGHACAVTADGVAHCWGANAAGQLGNTTSTNVPAPAAVQGDGMGATKAVAGKDGSCGVTDKGAAVCWGTNTDGQLGTGTPGGSAVPVPVKGLTAGVTAIDAGSPTGKERCAVQQGKVLCWGTPAGSSSSLGNGTTRPSATPVEVSSVSDVRSVSVGTSHACALDTSEKVWCWGGNLNGQVGDGSTTTRTTAVPVTGITDPVVTISAGNTFTCAVTKPGAVWCWGSYPGAAPSSPTPVQIPGIARAARVSGGTASACVVVDSGQVRCWGANLAGELGDGTRNASDAPVAVSGISNAIEVDMGQLHACAVLDGGTVRCWGQGIQGQLGDGKAKASPTPVDVTGLEGATAVSTGNDHTCAVTPAGATCWGDDTDGEVGVAPPAYVPTDVSGTNSFA